MRNGQKRMRGRNNNNHRKSQNPLTRVYELNGPDVKIRGTASHVAEKYIQLARDSQSSGDPVAAENYYQHAEHYFRLIAAAQEQFRQQNPYYNNQQNQQGQGAPQGAADDNFDDDGDEGQPYMGQNEPSYAPQPPAPQASLSYRATRSRFRRATSNISPACSISRSSSRISAMTPRRMWAACRPSSPAAGSSRNSSPIPDRTTATSRAAARTVSAIAGAGVIAAAAASGRNVRIISATPARRARRRSRPGRWRRRAADPAGINRS